MVKTYFLWLPVTLGNGYTGHVGPAFNRNFGFWGTVQELSYTGGMGNADPRALAVFETNKWTQLNNATPEGQTPLDMIKTNLSMFNITIITPERALALCNQWYPPQNGDSDYFSLDVDGFTLIDNRPEPEL